MGVMGTLMAERKKASILYIDDEVHNLNVFKAAFRHDYNIFTCASTKEAIQVLRKNDIDLIITDQRMPEQTGVEFLEEIIPEYPDTIRIILTGFSDVDAIIKAINTGCVFRYITKPWDEKELKQDIEIAIKMHDIEARNRELIGNLKDELAKQERVLSLFQKYVPENIIHQSLKKEDSKTLFEGEICPVTVLFIDIRGFTTIASRLEPKKTVTYLNKFFTAMSKAINKHHGTVDKFIGDSILAIFGAPFETMYSQRDAVFSAVEMIEELKAFNEIFQPEIDFQTRVGIGINSGEAVIGNIGSESRIEYTAIGDVINVASRIENFTRDKPDTIVISESTFLAVKDYFLLKPLGPQELKGKSEKIPLYEVVSRKARN